MEFFGFGKRLLLDAHTLPGRIHTQGRVQLEILTLLNQLFKNFEFNVKNTLMTSCFIQPNKSSDTLSMYFSKEAFSVVSISLFESIRFSLACKVPFYDNCFKFKLSTEYKVFCSAIHVIGNLRMRCRD